MGKKLIEDHLGHEFDSIKEMCDYWHVDDRIYRSRIYRGMSVKEALTSDGARRKVVYSDDDLKEIDEMDGISETIKRLCIDSRIPIKDIRGLNTGKNYIDYNGCIFKSFRDLCRYHNVSESTIRSKVKNGMNINEAIKSVER